MKLPRIRLLKTLRDRPVNASASVSDDAADGGEPVPAVVGSMATQLAEPALPRRQPKFPQVKVDRTPVDLTVLRKVLDALNEQLPLIRRQPSRSAALLPRAETAGLAIDEIALRTWPLFGTPEKADAARDFRRLAMADNSAAEPLGHRRGNRQRRSRA